MPNIDVNAPAPQEGAPGPEVLPQMFGEVSKALFQIAEVMKDSGAPPELQEKMAGIANEYNSVLELMGGQGPAPEAGGDVPTSAEPGSENARPV